MNSENHKKLVGQRLNSALAMRNVKQKELARVLGVKDNAISYFCNGERTPNTDQITKISQYLQVSADYLLGLTDVVSSSQDVRQIVAATGLSENNVSNLLHVTEVSPGSDTLELANFLLRICIGGDIACTFADMKLALQTPSRSACMFSIMEELEKQYGRGLEVWEMREIQEALNTLYDDKEAQVNYPGGFMLKPEDAFSYFCGEIVDQIKEELKKTYESQNQWAEMGEHRTEILRKMEEKMQECPPEEATENML